MTDLACTGRDGITRTFQYDYQEDALDHQRIFRVYTKPPLENRPGFEMIFDEIDDETVRQTSIHHHGIDEYRAKGIPDAMLPEVANLLAKKVTSSPQQGVASGVYRTTDAEKMWARLRGKGLAGYEPEEDVYIIL